VASLGILRVTCAVTPPRAQRLVAAKDQEAARKLRRLIVVIVIEV